MVANTPLDLSLLPLPHYLKCFSHGHLIMAHGDHNGDIIFTLDLLYPLAFLLCSMVGHVFLSKS